MCLCEREVKEEDNKNWNYVVGWQIVQFHIVLLTLCTYQLFSQMMALNWLHGGQVVTAHVWECVMRVRVI